VTDWLVDTSALARLGASPDVTVGRADRRGTGAYCRGDLADRGHHRAPSVPGIIVAAVAEAAGLTVHLDKDFELIAEFTGQPTERLAVV